MPFAYRKLENILQFSRGFDITKAQQTEGNYPVISSSGPSSYNGVYKCEGPGVITGRKGTLGKVFFTVGDYWPHDTTLWVKDFKGNDPRYIYYLLTLLHFESFDVGASNPTLNRNHVHKISVQFPENLPTQQRIAGILSAYDELIEVNNQRIRLLEDTASQLYKEWFVRLRFPGHEQTKFVKGLPEGWEVKKVADAFDILGGGTPSTKMPEFWDGDVNWFTPSDITAARGMFLSASSDKITKKGYENSSAKLFPAYSVMMTSRATIGEVGINTLPATTNQGFIMCLPNEQIPYQYLYFWVYFNKETFEMLASGSTFLEITKGTFKKIDFLVPSADTMAQYVNLSAPIFFQIETLQSQNTQLRQIRDRLLPRLISGKLSVGAVASNLA